MQLVELNKGVVVDKFWRHIVTRKKKLWGSSTRRNVKEEGESIMFKCLDLHNRGHCVSL